MTRLTKTTSKGQTIIVTETSKDGLGNTLYAATIDGVPHLTNAHLDQLPRAYAGKVPAEYTHYLTPMFGKAAPILLTTAEATTLEPPVAPSAETLPRTARTDLVFALRTLRDEQDAAYQRAHDEQNAAAEIIREEYEPKIAAAAAALAHFDAAHPEIIAAIREERAARDAELIASALRA